MLIGYIMIVMRIRIFIKGTVRNDNLGGNLIDEELIKYWMDKFKKETGIIIQKDSKPYR